MMNFKKMKIFTGMSMRIRIKNKNKKKVVLEKKLLLNYIKTWKLKTQLEANKSSMIFSYPPDF